MPLWGLLACPKKGAGDPCLGRRYFLNMNEEIKVQLEEIRKCVSVIEKAIVGDMSDPKNPGLLVRIDRLEQSKRLKDKVLWAIASSLIYLLVQQVV